PPVLPLIASHYIPIHLLFFSTPPATPDIYPLSLHDALPISSAGACISARRRRPQPEAKTKVQALTMPAASRIEPQTPKPWRSPRSEEHTSELQSQSNLVCRLLLEKKKKKKKKIEQITNRYTK